MLVGMPLRTKALLPHTMENLPLARVKPSRKVARVRKVDTKRSREPATHRVTDTFDKNYFSKQGYASGTRAG